MTVLGALTSLIFEGGHFGATTTALPTYPPTVQWVLARPGVSCDCACAQYADGVGCDESMWPMSESVFSALLGGVFLPEVGKSRRFECISVGSGGGSADPSSDDRYCGWQAWQREAGNATSSRCSTTAIATARRFCPCNVLLPGISSTSISTTTWTTSHTSATTSNTETTLSATSVSSTASTNASSNTVQTANVAKEVLAVSGAVASVIGVGALIGGLAGGLAHDVTTTAPATRRSSKDQETLHPNVTSKKEQPEAAEVDARALFSPGFLRGRTAEPRISVVGDVATGSSFWRDASLAMAVVTTLLMFCGLRAFVCPRAVPGDSSEADASDQESLDISEVSSLTSPSPCMDSCPQSPHQRMKERPQPRCSSAPRALLPPHYHAHASARASATQRLLPASPSSTLGLLTVTGTTSPIIPAPYRQDMAGARSLVLAGEETENNVIMYCQPVMPRTRPAPAHTDSLGSSAATIAVPMDVWSQSESVPVETSVEPFNMTAGHYMN